MESVNKVTAGVSVTVSTEYQPEYSAPIQNHYVFTYKIVIENHSSSTVQLISRLWYIYDSNGTVRVVQGDGVVGQQPTLEPGDKHEYISGCNLRTGMGKMNGFYMMERVIDGHLFEVHIPEFSMVVPYFLN